MPLKALKSVATLECSSPASDVLFFLKSIRESHKATLTNFLMSKNPFFPHRGSRVL